MLGNNIRKIREENDISQRELGEVLHVTKQTISNWENGKSYPDLQTLVAISNRYGVSLDVMLKEDLELIAEIDRQRKAARRRIRIGVVILLLIVIAGFHMTETGALRASAFFYSPISTFTMVYEKLGEDESYPLLDMEPEDRPVAQYVILQGDPLYESVGAHFPYGIYRFGPFYYARHFGAP